MTRFGLYGGQCAKDLINVGLCKRTKELYTETFRDIYTETQKDIYTEPEESPLGQKNNHKRTSRHHWEDLADENARALVTCPGAHVAAGP